MFMLAMEKVLVLIFNAFIAFRMMAEIILGECWLILQSKR